MYLRSSSFWTFLGLGLVFFGVAFFSTICWSATGSPSSGTLTAPLSTGASSLFSAGCYSAARAASFSAFSFSSASFFFFIFQIFTIGVANTELTLFVVAPAVNCAILGSGNGVVLSSINLNNIVALIWIEFPDSCW